MANNTVLQWQSHVTDSTDREVILGNIDLLEKFALSINGGDKYTISDGQSQVTGTLSSQFELLRTGIKNGTLKPASWKDSEPFGKITTALENVSSGKLLKRVGTAEGNITSHGKALSNYGKRIKDAEGDITDHGTRLDTAEGNITSHEETLSGYGTRIGNAEDDIKKKLGISEFNTFVTGDTSWKSQVNKTIKGLASSSELDHLRTLIDHEVSHWTRETTPEPLEYTTLAVLITKSLPWELGDAPERHIGDLCTVIGAKQSDKGVSYRFVKHPDNNTYKWTKVIDNDGILALNKHREFVTQYDKDYANNQSAIDALKKRLGFSDTDTDKSVKELLEEERQERKKIYKVSVTTQGYIKDGAIKDGTTYGGKPAIVHTAHVYTLTGTPVVKGLDTTLTWTINKGRTTKPVARTVTGVTCYVTADDFVKDGTNPHYYDIELNSTF